MDVTALKIFLVVARERSFSRAAVKLQRSQPAVSQAVRRLERSFEEVLFDRSSKSALLTEAGVLLQEQGERLLRLMDETETSVKELKELRRGRVVIGANESAIPAILPVIALFRQQHPELVTEVSRVQARNIGTEVVQGNLDFGVLTFEPPETTLKSILIGSDDLVLLVSPSHELARQEMATLQQVGQWPVIAHNDPSPMRERVLRRFEQQNVKLNIMLALPSLDAIKRAVEMNLGIALLPRRCALTELAAGRLVALHVTGMARRRRVLLVCREKLRSRAATAFAAVAINYGKQTEDACLSSQTAPDPRGSLPQAG